MNSNVYRLPRQIAAALVALSTSLGFGQSAPAPSPAGQEAAVKLDPFSVSADSDVGFVAASSLAGGRIATALKDTPVAYTVITKEFLDAFNITDTAQAVEWTPSGANNNADNAGSGSSPNQAHRVTIRGVRTGTPLRNYFSFFGTPDSYSLDRVDLGRGPNAVLYGAGGQAGTQNSITKQAQFSKVIREVSVRSGSFDRFRFTADLNQPVTEKFALRTNLMWDRGNTWKESEYELKKGAQLAAGYQLTPKLTLRGEVEFMKSERLVMTQMKDQTSAWDGKSTLATTLPLSGAGAPTTSQLAQMGLVRLTNNRFVVYPDAAWEGQAINFRNEYRTKGAAHSATAANTNYINGKPIRTVGYSLNNQSVSDLQGIDANVRWASALSGSPFFHNPRPEENNLWDNQYPTWNETDLSQTLSINYRLNENFFVEIAGNINRSDYTARQTNRRGLNEQRIDVARVLPNGVPNPFFLHPYSEHMDYNNDRRNTFQNVRFQAGYTKDSRFGKLQLAALGGATNHLLVQRGSSLLLPITSLAPDARTWVDNLELSEYGLYTRRYMDQPSPDYLPETEKLRPVKLYNPINGVTEIVTPKRMFDTKREDNNVDSIRKSQFMQFAGNLDLFKNRLVLIGAFRRDVVKLSARRVRQPGSYAAGWDGTTIDFRKPPPTDYYEMMFVPKNAAGVSIGAPLIAETRPRVPVNNAQLPAPQYVNDRFRDDYDTPNVSPQINTATFGAVVNLTRNIGLYANIGDTYEIGNPRERLNGSLALPTTSEGKDAGIRFTLPNGRLSLSVGWYSSYQKGNQVGIPIAGALNTFADTSAVGDLSSTGQNIRGARRVPSAAIDTNTISADGYELDLTANLTPAWRLMFNVGKNRSLLSDQWPDSLSYFKSQEATARQVLQDAGILIDANNDARINPALDDPTKINQVKATAAVNAWNTLLDSTMPNIVGQFQQQRQGVVPWIGNLATDYRFRNGLVRGLRVGLGVQYRSGMIVGYRGNDTIVDPSNPNAAIDDPAVDARTLVTGNANYKVTATLSYVYRFKENGSRFAPKTIQFDLNIDNVLNDREPIYGYSNDSATTAYTFSSPRNGDWTQPARITLPGTPSYYAPRNFLLTAKMNF